MTDLAKKILNILYISGDEVSVSKIAEAIGVKSEDVINEVERMKEGVSTLGLKIIKKDNHFMISSHEDHHELLQSFSKKEIDSELSPAGLQTITIAAYMPGATANEISFIRGVESSKSLRNLLTRGLLEKKNDKYYLTFESLKHLGAESNEHLPDFKIINKNLHQKLNEALNE
jgi:segregation and condensation protein B